MSDKVSGNGTVQVQESDVLHAVHNIHGTANEIKGTVSETNRLTKEIHAAVTKKGGNA